MSDEQVDYILETKLRQLARLEEEKIDAEIDKLTQEQHDLEELLAHPEKLMGFIKMERYQRIDSESLEEKIHIILPDSLKRYILLRLNSLFHGLYCRAWICRDNRNYGIA